MRGIIAVEPSSPPFENTTLATGPARAWGPMEIHLTYDPPVTDPKELQFEKQAEEVARCSQ